MWQIQEWYCNFTTQVYYGSYWEKKKEEPNQLTPKLSIKHGFHSHNGELLRDQEKTDLPNDHQARYLLCC